MNTRRLLIVLLVPFLASCGTKKSTNVGMQNEGEIRLFDFDGYSTAATPGGGFTIDPSKVSNLTATFGGGGGSVSFTAGGRASSFAFTSRSSSMTASGRAQSFKLTSVSSAFSASAPTASAGGASYGSFSGSCDWESALRSVFTSLYSGAAGTEAAAAASSEAAISGLRPYIAGADPRIGCFVAGIYTCLATSILATDPTASAMGGCIVNVCTEVIGTSQCSSIGTAFSGSGAE